MKNISHRYLAYVFVFITMVLITSKTFAIARTWTGAGAGGAGTDFNNVANWSGGGALATGDDFTMTFTTNTSQTISLSANITVNNLTVTENSGSGLRTTTLNVGAFTLTVNGTGTFNAVRYSNGVSYDVLRLNINNSGNIIFNGVTRIHTTGNGDTYVITENLAGGGATPGTLTFNNNVYIGVWGRTVGAYEPHIVFNGTGAQTMVLANAGGGYLFKAQNLTFGTTNTPTVTIRGPSAANFDTYDGNMIVAANTTVIIPDTTVTGRMTVLGRYNTGAGSLTMGAGSTVRTGCPNRAPLNGFATYTMDATSTVWYNSTGWQDMLPITYGHVIADGVSAISWKYSNGAQTMQGNFTVQNSAIYGPWSAGGIVVQGNTLLQSSGVFNATRDNNVASITHTIRGNFTNNSTFTSGTPVGINTMQFTGTAAQTIAGTTLTTAFYNFVVNNTSATGVTLTTPLSVNSALTLTDGNVYTDATNLLTLIDNATSTAGSSASFVDGPMRKIGNDAFVFPVGDNVIWARTAITAPSVATDADTAQYFDAAYSTLTPVAATIAYVSSVEHWIVNRTAGTSNVFVTLYWENGTRSGINTFTTDLHVARYDGATWQDHGSGTMTGSAALGTIQTSAAVTAFSPFTFSSVSVSILINPLPIELLSFEAQTNNNHVDLKWSTASETNNDFFTIEKSKDGQNFVVVGKEDGAGNSTTIINYSGVDYSPYTGISYYRLKQTDFNGQFTYSNIIPVEFNRVDEANISIFPNPLSAGNASQVRLSMFTGEVLVVVRDAMGKEVFSKMVNVSSDSQLVTIDSDVLLAKGIYLVTASNTNAYHSQKLVIK